MTPRAIVSTFLKIVNYTTIQQRVVDQLVQTAALPTMPLTQQRTLVEIRPFQRMYLWQRCWKPRPTVLPSINALQLYR